MFAWEGAIAVASPNDVGRYGSHRFITCGVDSTRANATYLKYYLTASPDGIAQVRKASPGGAGRNRTLGVEKLGRIEVPLPPLAEQNIVVTRLDALAEKTQQVEAHLDSVERDAERLLALLFRGTVSEAPERPMAEAAPLVRRDVVIDPQKLYTELGIRSFFKGTFQRRTILGADFSWQDLYAIQAGDLVFSNIMAWERAIAIARPEDDGCVGNHRMLTCEANAEIAVANYLWYYFTTEEGFAKIYAASPGTAARNRTMTAAALMAIEVPVPSLTAQRSFQRVQAQVNELMVRHAQIRKANASLLPATLERIFAAD